MAYFRLSRALSGIQALGATSAGLACWAAGVQADPPQDKGKPHLEMWLGGETFHDFWSVYSGGSWAPFGGVQEDGLRMRAVLGYGGYHGGTATFGDVLIGYHWQTGPFTLKVLGGMTVADHHPGQDGTSIGGKGIVEAWWNITDRAWTSADLSWGSLNMDRSARVRLGWRFWPELSAGLEGGTAGTWDRAIDRDITRAGGFLRYEWAGGEVSMSGGVASDGREGEGVGQLHPFGTVSVLTRF